MSGALKRRVARLELRCVAAGDWRQVGNDQRYMQDCALVASLLCGLESFSELKDRAELIEARRLYYAGEIDAAFELLQPILVEHRRIDSVSVQRKGRGRYPARPSLWAQHSGALSAQPPIGCRGAIRP